MELTREFLENMLHVVPGNVVIYRAVEGRLDTLYFSEGIPALSGMKRDEYMDYIQADALQIVIDVDWPLVVQEMEKVLYHGENGDIVYRIFHKARCYVWIHANARVMGRFEGAPVVLCTFLATTLETSVQMDLLDHSNNYIYVVEDGTWEVLYAI